MCDLNLSVARPLSPDLGLTFDSHIITGIKKIMKGMIMSPSKFGCDHC